MTLNELKKTLAQFPDDWNVEFTRAGSLWLGEPIDKAAPYDVRWLGKKYAYVFDNGRLPRMQTHRK